ncbi:MAG: hypothetical protein NTY02_11800 [Acidobacteria bacterium]|nr:hypothetical protein [Acidobacteriota bacterium]
MTRLVKVALPLLAVFAIAAGTLVAQTTPPVTPIRGDAEIGVLTPVTVVDHKAGLVRTTIKVKNLSTTGSIAGLKVEEFWYDKAGNPVTGSRDRLKKPLMPLEVAELKLETPKDPKMDRNSYTFTHANGKIRTKNMKTF